MNLIFKVFTFLLIITLFTVSPCFAGKSGVISATSTEAKTDIGGKHLMLVNRGSDEVYISVRERGQDAVTSTTSSFQIANGASATFDSDTGFINVSTICDTAETASVDFLSWE